MGFFGTRGKTARKQATFEPVAGEQLFVGELSYQPALKALLKTRGHSAASLTAVAQPISEPFVARLTPELDNKYDANAVAVHVDGKVVAYLSRANAARYRTAFEAAIAEVPVVLWVKANGSAIVSVWPER